MEAINEYEQIEARSASLRLDPSAKEALAQAIARLRPKLGRVLIRKPGNGKCQESSLWTLPGTISVNLGDTSQDVDVHANQTVRLGSCP